MVLVLDGAAATTPRAAAIAIGGKERSATSVAPCETEETRTGSVGVGSIGNIATESVANCRLLDASTNRASRVDGCHYY